MDTVPKVNQPKTKTLREVASEILLEENSYTVDGIPQTSDDHVAMMIVQDKLIKYLEHNWSLDRNEMRDILLRCEEIAKYLNLITSVSYENRYKKLPSVKVSQIEIKRLKTKSVSK